MTRPLSRRRPSRRGTLVGALLTMVLGASGAAPLAGALTPAAEAAPRPSADEHVVVPSGRAYVLHEPPAARRDPRAVAGRPVMVFLHGLRSDPADAARSTGFNALADRDGVMVAYPFGIKRSFNSGLCCGDAVPLGVDDVAFLTEVVLDLRARGAGRISVVGFSNGGMMAYRFACARPELVDTVGVMSGTLEIPKCTGRIRALHLHGERDTAVPWAGSNWSEKLRAYLRPVPSIPRAAPGSALTIRRLKGYGHRWTEPGDGVDATAEFWRFARMTAAS